MANSRIAEQGSWNQLRLSTGYISTLESERPERKEAQKVVYEPAPIIPGTEAPSNNDTMDLTRKTGDFSVYCRCITEPRDRNEATLTRGLVYYFKAAGLPALTIFLILNTTYGIATAITPYVLKLWTEARGQHAWTYVSLYAISSLLALAANVGVVWCVPKCETLPTKSD